MRGYREGDRDRGAAGIGKTALVEAARVGARARGMGVLDARGSELEAEYPFGVVRQCLEPALRAADTRDREQLLAGAAALAAPVLLDAPSEGEAASFGVLHGLYWLLANLSERGPLLLAIDDAHWVDEPSLRFVAHLTRRVESLPAMLILATRPVDPSDREPGLLAELLADPDRELLTPAVLGEPAVAELLSESVAGPVDERFARACQHASGGNPFLLTELERTLRDEQIPFTAAGAERVGEITPLQVARATRARLARLDPAAGALARAIVVLGDDAPLGLACELAGLERTVATRAADALISAGLLDSGRLLRFRHPLLRSAVAASLTPFEREGSHRSAAELLRDRGAPPERIAVHLLAATPSGQGADAQTLLAAATRAVERGAPGAAVPLFLRALDEPLDGGKRTSVLLGLGRAEFAAGQVAAAAEHLDQARRSAGDLISRARALVLLMDASTQSAANIQAIVEVAPAIEEISEHDRELALRLQAWVMLIRHPATAISDARLEQLSALPGGTPGEAVVLAHLIFRRMAGATAEEVAYLAERAARQVDALVQDGTAATAFTAIMLGLRWSDRLDAAERVLERAIAIARHRGSAIDFANAMDLRAQVFVRRGILREAEADARASRAATPEGVWHSARGVVPLLRSLVGQGRTEEAARTLETEIGDAELGDIPPVISLVLVRAQVRAACGDHAGALTQFDDAVRRRDRWGGLNPSWVGDILLAARSHHALGDNEAAGSLLAQALKLAQRWSTPGALGQAAHAQALLGGDGDRIELLREAVTLLERSPARLELAPALVDLGAALRRAGHRSDSRDPLRAGYALARECGADALAQAARQELAASGVRLRRERITGAQSLTPSERRIADMAADGSSNTAIAQALFLTVKTVEMHLTHTYRKLEIAGCSQLPKALADAPNHLS